MMNFIKINFQDKTFFLNEYQLETFLNFYNGRMLDIINKLKLIELHKEIATRQKYM
jgi:hypothetical protein